MNRYRQFVLCKFVPKPDGGTEKIPVDLNTGSYANSGDPSIWTDYQTAYTEAAKRGAGWGVGFHIAAETRLFFIDIDHCLTPSGSWSSEALRILAMFPGAYVELSQSGTGLHILGSYTGSEPPHKCKNAEHRVELYTSGRMMALGGRPGALGDSCIDHTVGLYTLISERFAGGTEVDEETEWTASPVPEWCGPADDETLIQRALASRSAAAEFGKRASFADLWNANVEALRRSYPDSGARPYDASSADAALAQHLAFWTGNNCARIETLMRQSRLLRDKYDRDDYLPRTIMNAVRRQTEWYADSGLSTPKTASAESTSLNSSVTMRPVFGFVRARDLLTKPEPIPHLIHELFESGSLAQLFGKSGCGKSFLAIDWACCVATGTDWCGRKVAKGPVFYIAGEGHSGMRKRLKVWEQHHVTPLADAPLFVSNAPAALMDAVNAANVARAVEVLAVEHGVPMLIIVDTLARNLGAGEENSNADIGMFINNLDTQLRIRFGATVLIVHHTGHGEQERSRGASSLRAAMDHEYRLEDKGGIRELSCTKAKESEPPPLMTFRLLPVTLSGWTNENGEFITSAVLVPTTDKPVANLLELTGANLVAHRALGNAIREFGVEPDPKLFTGCTNAPLGRVASEESWRNRAYDEGISDGEQDAKKKAFSRSRKALIDKNLIATWKDFYWPVSMPGHGTLPGHSGTLSRAQGDRPGHTSIDVSRCPAPVA